MNKSNKSHLNCITKQMLQVFSAYNLLNTTAGVQGNQGFH